MASLNGKIIIEIVKERSDQDEQWGGPTHDDTHSREDWCCFIENQLMQIRNSNEDISIFRARMVKVAALAVAAIERTDRYVQGFKNV